ncbi:hypothetical protein BGZ73_002964 [Actinomortierella ambigua]|nr:hypothetical protein BGZ73_002964 [Actinomortierella ambigua]
MDSSTTARRNNPDYWCHQIEADNDPRDFVDLDNDNLDNDDGSDGHVVQMDDLLRLLQIVAYGQGSRTRTAQPTLGQQQDDFAQLLLSSFLAGPPPRPDTTTAAGAEPTGTTDTHGASTTSRPSATADGHDGHDGQTASAAPHPDFQGSSGVLISLLERLGIPVQYTPNAAAFSTFGGGLFNMVGNPGDYVFGQNGLDDIITQLMEQQSRMSGPIGATDETINKVPRHKLTQEELDVKLDCSVCKDEFTMDDSLLQLECKHIFHEDCLKPWLKMSGTCPTCRFSIISDADRQAAGRPASDNNVGSNSGASGSSNSSASQQPSSSTSSSSTSTSQPTTTMPRATPMFSLSLPNAFQSLFGPRSTAQVGSSYGNSTNQGSSNQQANNSSNSQHRQDDDDPHFDPLD